MNYRLSLPACSLPIMLLTMAVCITLFTGMKPGMNKSSPPASIIFAVADTSDGYNGERAGAVAGGAAGMGGKPDWCYTAYANCQNQCYNAANNWTIYLYGAIGSWLGGPIGGWAGVESSIALCREGCTMGFENCP